MIWPMASTFYATKFFVRGKQEVTNAENGSREGPESKCQREFSLLLETNSFSAGASR